MKLLVGPAIYIILRSVVECGSHISKSFAHAMCVHKAADFIHQWVQTSEMASVGAAVIVLGMAELVVRKLVHRGTEG